jgi:hypothetical protein
VRDIPPIKVVAIFVFEMYVKTHDVTVGKSSGVKMVMTTGLQKTF